MEAPCPTADLLFCGLCKRGFRLTEISKFIDHKRLSCSEPALTSDLQPFECCHCDAIFLTPFDILRHAQLGHNMSICRAQLGDPNNHGTMELDPKGSTILTQEEDDAVLNNGNSTINSNLMQGAQLPEKIPELGDTATSYKLDGMIVAPKIQTSNVEVTNDQPDLSATDFTLLFRRKTCCLFDGGSPCTQISSCPVLTSGDRELSDMSSVVNTDPDEVSMKSSLPSIPPSSSSGCSEPSDVDPITPPASKLGYACELCDRKFSQKIHLKKHFMSFHLDEKPFKCDWCEYRTVERSHLKMHTRRHTGERPYACFLCNYKAAQHSTLKQHCIKKHQEMFVCCRHCKQRFITLTDLDKHNRLCRPSQDVQI